MFLQNVKINFNHEKYKNNNQIEHVVYKKEFPKNNNPWRNQAIQREFILENLNSVDQNDYIMFSDPDEIPNPKLLKDLKLKKNLKLLKLLNKRKTYIFTASKNTKKSYPSDFVL